MDGSALLVLSVLLLVIGLLASLSGLPHDWHPTEGTDEGEYEQGYLLRRKCDGYPLIVGFDAYEKAFDNTDDYDFEGVIDRQVPVGQQYMDERLN